MPLDREQTAVYYLTLVARDSSPTEPRASAVNLTIYVTDENDNAPRFSSPRYTAYVPSATEPGIEIGGNTKHTLLDALIVDERKNQRKVVSHS